MYGSKLGTGSFAYDLLLTEENIQATPYEIAEAYDVLKVTIEGLEKVEKTLYTITIENGSIRGGSSTGEYEAGTVL